MSRNKLLALSFPFALAFAGPAAAAPVGLFISDTFGYEGDLTLFNTLADAQNGVNPVTTFPTGVQPFFDTFIANGFEPFGGPTFADGNLVRIVDPGLDFLDLNDNNSSTDSFLSFNVSPLLGGEYEFTVDLDGGGAGSLIEYAYNVAATVPSVQMVTADGLEFIISTDDPTAVTGTYTGIAEVFDGVNTFFFDFDLAVNLAGPGNLGSRFAVQTGVAEVPAPATLALLAAGILGLVSARALRKGSQSV